MKLALLIAICCACGESPPDARRTFGPGAPPPHEPASMEQLLSALPSNSPLVIAVDAASLRTSPLARNVWQRVIAFPAFAARIGDPCMQTFATTDRMVIVAPPTFTTVLAIDQGPSQTATARCREQPTYRKLVADSHMEWKVWDRYEAIADSTQATQLSWAGPELSVIVHGPTANQWPADRLALLGARIGRPGMLGPLDRPEIQQQLVDAKLDRTAPIWGVFLVKQGVIATFALRVTEVADVQITLLTESPAAAVEATARLSKALERARLAGTMSVGFAVADEDRVAITIQMSEAQVWEWLLRRAGEGSHRNIAPGAS